ncbi:Bicyclomycin resistance protein [invertebrate metagenome]|uniref:Bicyclomycin resistance protein n=1 Tax=invertebrate metagenome TaxID=1711999 RepID=A0A2H9T578_9ZZZZ
MKHLIPEKKTSLILAVLTLFAVVGPVSIDIFTPSLPAITHYFGTNNQTAQWSVGLFMLGFSLSMLICGPLSDRYGRKKTLFVGYLLYLVATVAILLTENIHLFIIARFFQALFGCFGTAIARTLARDYYSDTMEVRMLAYIGACLTLAPMISPIAGGFIQEYAGWHYSFVVMLFLAVMALAALSIIPERYQPATQKEGHALSGYIHVLSDFRYLRLTVASGAAFAGAFVFVAGASFVFIGQLSISPKIYGLIFAGAIASYMVSAAMAPRINEKLTRLQCVQLSGIISILGAVISLISGILSNGISVFGYIAGIFIYELGLGIYMPLCQAMATEHIKKHMGTACSLIFFIEMLLATLISSAVHWLPEWGTTSLSIVTLLAIIFSTLCRLGINSTMKKPSASLPVD